MTLSRVQTLTTCGALPVQPGYSVVQFVIPKNKPAGLSIVPSDDAYVTAGSNQVPPPDMTLTLILTLTLSNDFLRQLGLIEPSPDLALALTLL